MKESSNVITSTLSGVFDDLQTNLNEELKRLDQETGEERPNILICGSTGSGKTTLIKAILGDVVPDDAVGAGLPRTKDFLFYENKDKNVAVYDSQGCEQGQTFEAFWTRIKEFIDGTRQDERAGKSIHLIWYGIDGTLGRIQPFDSEFIKSVSKIAPVIVVILKNDATKEDARQEFKKILIEEEGIPQDRLIFTSGKTEENTDNGCKELVSESIKLLPEACRLKFIRSQICDVQSKIKAEVDRLFKAATRPLIDSDQIRQLILSGKEKTQDTIDWISEKLPWTDKYKEIQEVREDFKKKVYVAGAIMTTFLLIVWRVLGCLQDGHYGIAYIGIDLSMFVGGILAVIGVIVLVGLSFKKSKVLGGGVSFLILALVGVLSWGLGNTLVSRGFAMNYVLLGCLRYLVFFLVPACLVNLFLVWRGRRFEDYYAAHRKKLPKGFWGAIRCWLSLTAGWIDITKEALGLIKNKHALRVAWGAACGYFKSW